MHVLFCDKMQDNNDDCITRSNSSKHEMSQLMSLMAFFVLRKLILQTLMRSHPVGLDAFFLSDPPSTSILHVCEQPSLVAYVISSIISWAGSNLVYLLFPRKHCFLTCEPRTDSYSILSLHFLLYFLWCMGWGPGV